MKLIFNHQSIKEW